MNTYLGASALFGPDDVDVDMVAAARVVYLEGYLFDRDGAKEAYRRLRDRVRGRQRGFADARLVLRRPAPTRVAATRQGRGRHPLRERDDLLALQTTSTRRSRAATVAPPRSRGRARLGDRRRHRDTRGAGPSGRLAGRHDRRMTCTRRVFHATRATPISRRVPGSVAGGVGGDRPPWARPEANLSELAALDGAVTVSPSGAERYDRDGPRDRGRSRSGIAAELQALLDAGDDDALASRRGRLAFGTADCGASARLRHVPTGRAPPAPSAGPVSSTRPTLTPAAHVDLAATDPA
jgi:hypothetical protein